MKTMMELIQPESVLAITATAGPRVVEDICRTLNISGSASESEAAAGAVQSDDSGVRVMNSDRDNIDVSCLILSNQEERLSKVNQPIGRGCTHVRAPLTYSCFHCSNFLQLIKLLTPAKRRAKGEHATEKGIEEGCLATGNVIVYVWRQLDAVAIAENLTASGVDGGVVVYHGGMDSGARSRSQSMVSART
jgi:superfamily II DNA helicase RecQ